MYMSSICYKHVCVYIYRYRYLYIYIYIFIYTQKARDWAHNLLPCYTSYKCTPSHSCTAFRVLCRSGLSAVELQTNGQPANINANGAHCGLQLWLARTYCWNPWPHNSLVPPYLPTLPLPALLETAVCDTYLRVGSYPFPFPVENSLHRWLRLAWRCVVRFDLARLVGSAWLPSAQLGFCQLKRMLCDLFGPEEDLMPPQLHNIGLDTSQNLGQPLLAHPYNCQRAEPLFHAKAWTSSRLQICE